MGLKRPGPAIRKLLKIYATQGTEALGIAAKAESLSALSWTALISQAGKRHSPSAARSAFRALLVNQPEVLNSYHVAAVVPYMQSSDEVEKLVQQVIRDHAVVADQLVQRRLVMFHSKRNENALAEQALTALEDIATLTGSHDDYADLAECYAYLAECYTARKDKQRLNMLANSIVGRPAVAENVEVQQLLLNGICELETTARAQEQVDALLALAEKGTFQPNENFFNVCAKVRGKAGDLRGLVALVKVIGSFGQTPSVTFFGVLIDFFTKRMNMREAEKCLDMMHQYGVQPNRYIWSSLILGYAFTDERDKVDAIFDSDADVDDGVLRCALRAYVIFADDQRIAEVVEKAKTLKMDVSNAACYGILEFGERGLIQNAEHLFRCILECGLEHRRAMQAYNALLLAYSENRKDDCAHKLYRTMQFEGPKPNARSYEILISQALRFNDLGQVEQYYDDLAEGPVELTPGIIELMSQFSALRKEPGDNEKWFAVARSSQLDTSAESFKEAVHPNLQMLGKEEAITQPPPQLPPKPKR